MDDHPFSAKRATRPSPARLILPVAGLGLLVAMIFAVTRSISPGYSEAEMLRSVHATALRRSSKPGVPDGGPLGPWWISAGEADPITGQFRDFSITTDTMIIAARIARVRIDPVADTFTIDMEHVVMTRFEQGPEAEEGTLVELESYTLGPAPFEVNIRPDAGGPLIRDEPEIDRSPLAGVQPPGG